MARQLLADRKQVEWIKERERRLQAMIASGELRQICPGMWSFAQPNQVAAQRMRREREKVQGICLKPRSACKNCRRIFEEGCRFNNTRSFWN